MTNNQAHEVIAIEQTKLFLLNVVPIDELPNQYIQETVSAYRQGDLTMIQDLQDFEGYQKELGAMVRVNKFLSEMIEEVR